MRAFLLALKAISPPIIGVILILKGIFMFLLLINVVSIPATFWVSWTELASSDGNKLFQAIIAIVLLILGLLWLLATFASKREGLLEAPSEGGRVTIQMQTAMEFVRKTAQQVSGVLDAQAKRVWQKNGITYATVDILPDFDQPVSTVAANVQERVRRELEQTLGLPSVQDVNVGIMPPKARSSASTPSRPRRSENPMDDIRGGGNDESDRSSSV